MDDLRPARGITTRTDPHPLKGHGDALCPGNFFAQVSGARTCNENASGSSPSTVSLATAKLIHAARLIRAASYSAYAAPVRASGLSLASLISFSIRCAVALRSEPKVHW